MKPMNLNKQRGAVLVVSLVLLTVLTLVGVASMQSSSLELRAASNAQQYTGAFEAALSRIEFATSQDQNNPLDYLVHIPDVNDSATWPVQTCDAGDGCPDTTGSTTSGAMEYAGACQPGVGFSLEDGRSVYFRYFNVTVDAAVDNSSARSLQVQGVRHPSAGC